MKSQHPEVFKDALNNMFFLKQDVKLKMLNLCVPYFLPFNAFMICIFLSPVPLRISNGIALRNKHTVEI